MDKLDGEEMLGVFCPKIHYIFKGSVLDRVLSKLFTDIQRHNQEFQERGSGWIVKAIDRLDLHLSPYEPLCASSYTPLPSHLIKKRAIVNIINNDQE